MRDVQRGRNKRGRNKTAAAVSECVLYTAQRGARPARRARPAPQRLR